MRKNARRLQTLGPFLLLMSLSIACGGGDADKQYADKMAEEHKNDAPTASPAVQEKPANPVQTSEVVYATVEGQDATGYLARPTEAAAELPAVIVIHEWWGLNDNIRAMAEKLAGEGYLALAVDLYNGTVATDRDGARTALMAAMENEANLEENLRQAHAFLEQQGASKVGSIGWCFGGGWSLRTGMLLPEALDAVVIYYGRVTDDQEKLAALDMPILGIFGALDEGIPVDGVKAFEAALANLGKDAQIHIYDEADHAFANPSGNRYQPEAAEDAWAKTLEFFDRTLAD